MRRKSVIQKCAQETLEARRLFSTAGDVDSAFGSGGMITGHATLQENLQSQPTSNDLAMDGSGKIIVAGSFVEGGKQQMLVARYNANGTLDTGFGKGGFAGVDFGASFSAETATCVTIDSLGRIVLAGTTQDAAIPYHFNFAVARLTSAGTLDTSFSGDGKTTFDFGLDNATPTDVAVGKDDRVVVAGWTRNNSGGDSRFAVARLTTAGNLDTGFSADGKQTFDFSSGDDAANAVAVLSDNRVVLAGYLTDANNKNEFAVVRLTSSGQLDNTFDHNGVAAASFGGNDVGQSLLVRSDGGYIVAGYSDRCYAAVASFTSTGAPNSVFGPNGSGKIDSSAWPFSYSPIGFTVYDGDGPIMIPPAPSGGYRVVIGRVYEVQLHADGSLDTNFSDSGFASLPASSDVVYDFGFGGAAVAKSGAVIVADNIVFYGSPNSGRGYRQGDTFQLESVKPDGSPDTNLNAIGHGTLIVPSVIDAVQVEVDGKLVAAGRDVSGDFFQQFKSTGSVNSAFGGSGRIEFDNIEPRLDPLSFIMRPEGGFYAYGSSIDTEMDGIALRIDKVDLNGSVDSDYAATETDNGTIDLLSGGYLAYGYILVQADFSVATLVSPDGTAHSFELPSLPGNDVPDYQRGASDIYPSGTCGAVIVQGDEFYQDNNNVAHDVPLIAKYNADGSVDTTFGNKGIVLGTFSILDVQRDGKAIYFVNPAEPSKGLKRLQVNGSADASFGINGIAGAGYTHFALDSLGRIVAWKQLAGGNVQIERYTSDGKIDTTFGGGNGIATVHTSVNGAANLIITPADDLVVTTVQRTGENVQWFATRLLGGGFAGIGPNQSLIVSGSATNDSINLSVSGSNIVVSENGKSQKFAKSSVKSIVINGYGGNDTVTIGSGIGAVSINGGDGNDVIVGGAGNDTLTGGTGHDQLFGEGGNDVLNAKDGFSDILDGGSGSDKASRDNSASVKDQVTSIESFI